jgi:CelD/BcsL family acetyltransferase involved in cellulose biosynthesis
MAVALQSRLGPSHIGVDVVSSVAGLDDLKADWERLVDLMDVPSPFLSWYWSRVWWEHFGGGHRMRVAVLREDGDIVGIAPFYLHRLALFNSAVPFGWPDRLTEQIEPVIPGRPHDQVHAVLNSWLLREHSLGMVAGIDRSVAQQFGARALRDDVWFEWRELPTSWDELLDSLTRSMRGNIRYYPRLLQRSGHTFKFRVASDAEAVRDALPTLFRLHTMRANVPGGEPHRDRLKEPVRRRFLDDLAGVLAPHAEMKIGLLEVDGEEVAAQLWFERAGTIFLHYSGYEPAWSRFSVAMVTTSEIIRQGIDRGMKRVEFLRGAKQFKSRWNTQQRVQADVYFVPHPLLLPVIHRVRNLRRTLRNRKFAQRPAQLTEEAGAD